jgi:hypothetical protein
MKVLVDFFLLIDRGEFFNIFWVLVFRVMELFSMESCLKVVE